MRAALSGNSNNKLNAKTPAISIAMAVYNGARFLPEMLESLARQTLQPDELIVCDNCSTDHSRTLIQEFAQRASFPVRLYVNDHNLGPDANFERAIGLCTKDLIYTADCDDVWLPQKLETIAARFAQSDEIGLVLSDRELVDDNLKPLGRTWCGQVGCDPRTHRNIERGRLDALLRSDLSGNVMAFRSRFKALILPMEVPWYVGYDQWAGMLVGAVARVAFVPEPLVRFRIHANQASGKTFLLNSTRYSHWRMTKRPVARYLLIAPLVLKRLLVNEDFHPSPDVLAQVAACAAHAAARMALPSRFLPRLAAVGVELASLRYHRYSSGFASAAKDALLGGAEFESGRISNESWFVCRSDIISSGADVNRTTHIAVR